MWNLTSDPVAPQNKKTKLDKIISDLTIYSSQCEILGLKKQKVKHDDLEGWKYVEINFVD